MCLYQQRLPRKRHLQQGLLRERQRKNSNLNPQHHDNPLDLDDLLNVSLVSAFCTEISHVHVLLMVHNKAIYHAEIATSLWDETINEFIPTAFADNQQQNKSYTFSNMLKQYDKKEFIMAI
eukprot:4553866-Ditylum_brightwellii.AAC.1